MTTTNETAATPAASTEVRIPIVNAHARDGFAARFRSAEGFVFRIRGTRTSPEGRYVDTEPPEVVVADVRPTCEYCGSITVADFLAALQTPGTHYSGSDWKYGYPHKFYIEIPCEPYRTTSCTRSETIDGQRVHTVEWAERTTRNHKFYTEHLLDATDDELAEWERIAAPLLGVRFFKNADGALMYLAPRGYRASGDV
jgi:hypothetical protein